MKTEQIRELLATLKPFTLSHDDRHPVSPHIVCTDAEALDKIGLSRADLAKFPEKVFHGMDVISGNGDVPNKPVYVFNRIELAEMLKPHGVVSNHCLFNGAGDRGKVL